MWWKNGLKKELWYHFCLFWVTMTPRYPIKRQVSEQFIHYCPEMMWLLWNRYRLLRRSVTRRVYPAQVSFPLFERQKARDFVLSNILIKLYWQNIDNYILLGSILCVKIVANLTQTQNYLHSCKRRFNINISFYYLYTWNTLSAWSFAAEAAVNACINPSRQLFMRGASPDNIFAPRLRSHGKA